MSVSDDDSSRECGPAFSASDLNTRLTLPQGGEISLADAAPIAELSG